MATAVKPLKLHLADQDQYGLPTPTTFFLLVTITSLLAVITTYTVTSFRFRLTMRSISKALPQPQQTPPPAPLLPYSIPWLGHSLSFLRRRPAHFWKYLQFTFANRPWAQTTQLLLAGRCITLLWDPVSVDAVFRHRELHHASENKLILINGLGMTPADASLFSESHVVKPARETRQKKKDSSHNDKEAAVTLTNQEINQEFLLHQASVSEATRKFIEFFRETLASSSPLSSSDVHPQSYTGATTEKPRRDDDDGAAWTEISLYAWLRPIMFRGSTTAFFGKNIWQIYRERVGAQADMCEDFYTYEQDAVGLFLGLPGFLYPVAIRARERVIKGLTGWAEQWIHAREREEAWTHLESAEGDVWWEERMGSRYIRERQRWYDSLGAGAEGRARIDLGFAFGLSSNAIPATGWTMAHILGTPGLLDRIRDEVRTAVRWTDQKMDVDELGFDVDIGTLVALPLLNSMLQEVLRMYMDTIISREVTEDMVVPVTLGEHGRGQVLVKKDTQLICSTWLGQRDPAPGLWTNDSDSGQQQPDVNTFCPERFLQPESDSGKLVFTTSGKVGSFFPFGGGRPMCPGRNFAKQEILGAVAVLVTALDWELVGFEDENGKRQAQVPGIKDGWPGSGVRSMKGDVRVRVRRAMGV